MEELQRRTRRVIVVDAKDGARYRRLNATAMKPNYEQALAWLDLEKAPCASRVGQMSQAGGELLHASGAQVVAVTLDADGALVFEHGRGAYRTYAHPERHARTTGAGDTFTAALALALAAEAPTPVAAELASSAAAVVVAKDVTGRCEAFELRQHLFSGDKVINDRERLAERVEYFRRQGRRIVFTNGCFDLLHPGHVDYLNGAKMLGDVLIVGINSDESIRRLKGPARPVTPLQDRMQVLAALSSVDQLVAFEEDTPVELLRLVKPDIFVKGGDYTRTTLPEASVVEALGGRVHILPLVPERSTTEIIASIRAAEAARPALQSLPGGRP
jgi:D-beta-D-heptose 7-phosphate kinase/D-beta-D-heptose 1-phosphate adenosyltransferase